MRVVHEPAGLELADTFRLCQVAPQSHRVIANRIFGSSLDLMYHLEALAKRILKYWRVSQYHVIDAIAQD